MDGKRARKKLKATAEALMFNDPSYIPLKKNERISYMETPSKPGNTIRFKRLISLSMYLGVFMSRLRNCFQT